MLQPLKEEHTWSREDTVTTSPACQTITIKRPEKFCEFNSYFLLCELATK